MGDLIPVPSVKMTDPLIRDNTNNDNLPCYAVCKYIIYLQDRFLPCAI